MNTEIIIKCIIEAKHAIVLDYIREITAKGKQLQTLPKSCKKTGRSLSGNTNYIIKDELYCADGLIFKLKQISIPMKLQHTVFIAAHLGMTKTNQILRQKHCSTYK